MTREEMIEEAYENYKSKTEIMMGHGFHGTLLSKEEFIDKCKTDTEFSETWGLAIEERVMSRKERSDYYYKHGNSEGIVEGSLDLPIWVNDETAHVWYDKRNVPTQQITVIYNGETLASYE